MAELLGFDRTLAYHDRCDILRQSGVAIWDVLQACHRLGSLDSSIDNQTVVLNDFSAFLDQYEAISTFFFNGAKAEALFKLALPTLTHGQRASLTFQRLPSTSPAYAAMPFEQKLTLWKKAISPILN
jgi:hypoxanthine-DNA glycosylase